MITEAFAAADRLAALGVDTEVVCVTSPGRLFEAVQARHGLADGLEDVYRHHGIDTDSVVRAALDLTR